MFSKKATCAIYLTFFSLACLCHPVNAATSLTGTAYISGDYSSGFVLQHNARLYASSDASSVGILASDPDGIQVNNNGIVDLSGVDTTITMTGNTGGRGIHVAGTSADVNLRGTITISSDRQDLYGGNFAAITILGADSNVTFSGAINSNTSQVHGVYVNAANSRANINDTDINVYGRAAHGISIGYNGGAVSAENTTINTYGNNSFGIRTEEENASVIFKGDINAYGAGSTTPAENGGGGISALRGHVEMEGNITTLGRNGYGVYAGNTAYANAGVEMSGDITTQGYGAAGIYALYGADVEMKGNIKTEGANAYGAAANYEAEVRLNDAGIKTSGENAYGIVAMREGSVTMNAGKIETTGDWADGVYASTSGDVRLTGVDITTRGNAAEGLAVNGGSVHLTGNIKTEGSYLTDSGTDYGAYGVRVTGSGSDVTVNGMIETAGDRAHGVFVGVPFAWISQDATVNITGDIKIQGDYASGIFMNGSGSVTMKGDLYVSGDSGSSTLDQASGVLVMNGVPGADGAVRLDGSVYADGTNATGLHTMGAGSKIFWDGDNEIITTSPYTGYAITASGGTIEMTGDKKIVGAIQALGTAGSTTDIATVTGDGVMDIQGFLSAAQPSLIDLKLRSGSVLTASSQTHDEESAINLLLENSTWRYYTNYMEAAFPDTIHHNVTNLTLSGGSIVEFAYPYPYGAYMSEDHTTLKAGNLVGIGNNAGTFYMNTDIVRGTGDKLVVTGSSTGAFDIMVQNRGSDSTTGDEVVTLVETADGGAEFKLANSGGQVSLGAYSYMLARTDNGTDWELYSEGESTPTADAAINTFTGAYFISYAETQTLLQRLGDLRDTPHLDGYWFRLYGGKFEANSRSFVKDFDMDYGGVQVGYDRKLENNWTRSGDLYVGAFLGYSRGDLDYSTANGMTGGSGTVDSRTMGLYGTYIRPSGFYADLVLKYMWMMNDYDVVDTDGEHVTGDSIHTGGVGASLEVGKRFRFGRNAKGGAWYIEPQLQYSWTHQDGGYFYASNGMRIGINSFSSSIGRIGMLLGYETEKTNFYAKISRAKEFDGDISIYANNVQIPESFSDDWWVFGLGFSTRFNDRNSIYIDVECTDGGYFDEPWRINAGWRMDI